MLKVGDTYQISKDLIGKITGIENNSKCWWKNIDGYNNECFSFLNDDGVRSYQKSILGYSHLGKFPVCESLEDLEKFLHRITEDYNLDYARKTYTKGTKYYLAHLTNISATVSEPEDFKINSLLKDFNDLKIVESYGNTAKNGHAFSEYILCRGKWAEIIQEETIIKEVKKAQEKVFEPIIIDGITFNHGDIIESVNITGVYIKDAKISLDGTDAPYICQNEKQGALTYNKLGYKYSWSISQGFIANGVKDLVLKAKSNKIKVEDLKYPDAVHITCEEDYFKIEKYIEIYSYSGNKYYLLGASGINEVPYTGISGMEDTLYTNYEFSDIILPEEQIDVDSCSGVLTDCKTSLNDIPITIKSFKESDFEIGDTITIIKYPGSWASLLNNNYPDAEDIDFPITGVIKKLKQDGDYIAMDCCGYGWDLTALIKRNCISNLEKTSEQSKFIEKDSNPEVKVGDYLFVLIKGKYFGDILKVIRLENQDKTERGAIWITHENFSFSGGGFRHSSLSGNAYKYDKHFRHATQEEITNYLVSTGELKVNTLNDVKPWDLKVNFILPIDDEDLPMVNIVKTKTVKVLDIED